MNSKDFIINKIRKLIKRFPALKASYSFHELSETHSVEILPKSIYYGDELFKQFEEDIIIEFITKFPIESICFLTEDSISPIENVELVYIGDNYEDTNSSFNTILQFEGDIFEDTYYEAFQNIFRDYKPEISGAFILEQEIKGVNSLPSFFPQEPLFYNEKGKNNVTIDASDYLPMNIDYSLAA